MAFLTTRTSGSRLHWASLAVLGAALLLGLSGPRLATAQDDGDDIPKLVGEIFEEVEDEIAAERIDRTWKRAAELSELGDEAVMPILDRVGVVEGQAKLVAAKALLMLYDEVESDELAARARETGIRALEDTAISDDAETPIRVSAIDLIATYGERAEVARLKDFYEEEREPLVKVTMARALRVRTSNRAAEKLLKSYVDSEDRPVREAAALALAEIGNVEAAKAVLNELKDEPTDRGVRARLYLKMEELYRAQEKVAGLTEKDDIVKLREKQIEELEEELEKVKKEAKKGGAGGAGPGLGDGLLEELVRKIKLFYVDEEKTETQGLVDAAAKGLVSALDPFSSYMTEEDTNKFRETMSQEYAGIGAVVQVDPRTRYLTIIRPIYSGPAYKAGLRTLDQVIEVEGESTYNKTVQELVGKLKGPKGTPVRIKVYRKGWRKPKDVVLTRDEITLVSVHHDMLPGDIGYLKLNQFGEKATEEVEEALVDLENRGMRALIFDLRGNPGGLLSAAVEVSDKFLKDDRLIVYSEGRNPQIAPRREFRTHNQNTHPPYPLIVLVDGSSASASEIVSGALQDHGRATLVGHQTFGKGSVQQLMGLDTTRGKSTLRLTIAYYYLPSGRCIHREPGKDGGVDPDVIVEIPDEAAWVIEERDRLLGSREIELYVQKHYEANRPLFKELADFDAFDHTRYPDFEAWYDELGTKLDKEHVRQMVRDFVRRLAQDDAGREFAADMQEDAILQHGVIEALEKLGDSPAEFPKYKLLADRIELARADAERERAEHADPEPFDGEKKKDGEGEKKKDDEKKDDGEGEKKDPEPEKKKLRDFRE